SQQSMSQAAQLQADLLFSKDPGLTTLILRSESKEMSAWGAMTWGEEEAGRNWVRLNAYGLPKTASEKVYHLWLAPKDAEPALAGALQPNAAGAAMLVAKDLPAADGGKAFVSLDTQDADKPGDPLFSVQLPAKK